MQYLKDYEITLVKIKLPKSTKEKAKKFARSHHYTFQEWLGILVEEELQKNNVLDNKDDTP